MENSELDLMMAGTDSAILMIEVSADTFVSTRFTLFPAFFHLRKTSLLAFNSIYLSTQFIFSSSF